MIKVYSKTGEVLNIIFNTDDLSEGKSRIDVTNPVEPLQCAIMRLEAGWVAKAHKHLNKNTYGHIQEVFVIVQGKAKLRIFDFDNTPIGDYTLRAGDVSILLLGGHSLEAEEDCLMYEFKTGPYEGQANDKTFI